MRLIRYFDTVSNMRVPYLDIVATYTDEPHWRLLDLRPDGLAEIVAFGRLSYAKARPDIPLHRHTGVIEVHYRDRGEQYWQIGSQVYHQEAGDLFVTLPEEVCSSGGHPVATGIMYWFDVKVPPRGKGLLALSAQESKALVRRFLEIPCRLFRATPGIKSLLDEILQLHDHPETFLRTVSMRHLMVRVLLEVIKAAERHAGSQVSGRIAAVTQMIRNRPEEDFQIRDLARQVHLSTSRFKSRFKAEIGVPPWLFILESKVEAAKQRLSASEESITQIAISLGFSSSQYFATVFKRITGVTPRDYRLGVFPHGPSIRRDDGQG
jgi:AraC-like DNA-binding protein